MTRPRIVTASGQAWTVPVLAVIALLVQLACAPTAWADGTGRPPRQEIEAFEQSLQPVFLEVRAIQEELGDLQATMRDVQSPRKNMDQPERARQDLELFRAANRRLARLERLVVDAERLRPSAGLEVPFVDVLLALQHAVNVGRNVQLWKLTGQGIYAQAARAHQAQAREARARYVTQMQELKREAAR